MRTGAVSHGPRGMREAPQYEYAQQDGVNIVRASGEIDLCTAHVLQELLEEAIGNGRAVVVDLTKATYIDSTGLNILIRVHERSKQHDVRLGFVIANASMHRIFSVLALQKLFDIFPSVDEALQKVQSAAASEQPTDWPSLLAFGS